MDRTASSTNWQEHDYAKLTSNPNSPSSPLPTQKRRAGRTCETDEMTHVFPECKVLNVFKENNV